MIPALSVLLIVALSLSVTRIAAVALVHTGLSRDSARFQARSAFSGVGFTTQEAEQVVGHPVRRRIVMALMLVGNVGIVTAMAALLLSLLDLNMGSADPRALAVLVGGVGLLWLLAASAWIDRRICRLISWALRRFTSIDARDYAQLLHLRDDYGISELCLASGDWLSGKTVREASLSREGVLVLGVACPGNHFIGAPAADTPLREGDTLILYGRATRIAELDRRESDDPGDHRHAEAMAEQREVSGEEHARAGRRVG